MDEIINDLYRLGSIQQPAFVVMGQDRIIQVDAGTAFMGPAYLRDIRKLLGEGRGPDLLFFTHLHFDHVGSAPYLCRHLPGMKLGGSRMLVRLLARAKMGETLTLLNQGLVRKHNMERVIQRIRENEYLALRKGKQPEEAFLLNLKAQVKLIAGSMNKVGTKGND